mmetsp:Transcript_41728/g.65158  ORF Transcript_41728/g.65158 Transcript_41728/m.65158 type:complete len:181 (+) Transcript_41728:359-901(+)
MQIFKQELHQVERRRSSSIISMVGGSAGPMSVSDPQQVKDKSKVQRIMGGGGLLPLEVVRAKAAEAMKAGWDWDLDSESPRRTTKKKHTYRKSYSENEVDYLHDLEDEIDGVSEVHGHIRTGAHEVVHSKRNTGFSIIKNSLAILREDLGEDLALAQGRETRYRSLNQEAEQTGLLASNY